MDIRVDTASDPELGFQGSPEVAPGLGYDSRTSTAVSEDGESKETVKSRRMSPCYLVN